ncbi:MAG: hypothetical protein A2Y34_01720 [Spirochaetes bacterium GWC1_27_15]|nr:MAG: hypothetical protein A2Z98_01345 [Spirochaetes bacterium GWB1_27_13]OHD26680.1 MAG: hypothetical protein A2Y34_01720 [Spirochaetes bacterium GWC1_27_15]
MKLIILFLLLLSISYNLNSDEQIEISFDSKNNFRQSFNDCALYSIKAIVTIIKNKNITISEISEKIKEFRFKNNYTLPFGIESVLKNFNIKFKILNCYSNTNEEKIKILKTNLNNLTPIIILVEYSKFQHYMTILGYNKKEFYIYDSVLTKDSKIPNLTLDLNGSLPGNRNIDYETLINMWNNGGMFGLYKNYGIVCFK